VKGMGRAGRRSIEREPLERRMQAHRVLRPDRAQRYCRPSVTITLDVGDLVRVRGREWVVEALKPGATRDYLSTVELACIADDAQGEVLRAVLESEIDVRLVQDDLWQQIARDGSDDPKVLAAHMRAVAWKTATAADRDLFQAPFRAGIRLDPYQLLPLSKALKLPRVNLLIADDVGLGKTVEAGLVLREMLLRRRVDFVVVSAPAAMITQWQDEPSTPRPAISAPDGELGHCA
jgi:hypothetical protein